jgi:hypothetical protein
MANDDDPAQAPSGAIVKRRWAIIPRRGSSAVILATVGAIALGNATPSGDEPGQSSAEGETQQLVADQSSPELR